MKLDLAKEFDRTKFATYARKLVADGAKCELKKVKAKRTINQNSYLHVCIACFCDETGYTIQEAKILLKRQFGSFMVYKKDGNFFLLSTAELDTAQMTEFIEWIRNVACFENLGVYVPTSEEYIHNQFDIDQKLQHIK